MALIKNKRVAIAAPREHAKSVWFTLIYVLWCILFKKKSFIVIISDTKDQAEEMLGNIIEELETNPLILEDFGQLVGYFPPRAKDKKKWTASDITTLSNITVKASGIKSKMRGMRKSEMRPDLIILDDVENDESVNNQEQRDKLKNKFNKKVLNLGSKDTEVKIIGTILHFDSLLKSLLDKPRKGWITKLYTALKPDGQPLWPEWWSLERLDEKRHDIGSMAFEQEFMNNPLDATAQIIKPVAYKNEPLDPNMLTCYAWVDLSSKDKEINDYTAMVTVGVHKVDGLIYVVMPERIKTADIYEQLDMIYGQYARFRHERIGFEDNAYQAMLAPVIQRESAPGGRYAGKYLPLVGKTTIKDKVTNAKSIAAFIENGTIVFNDSYQDFIAELVQFPKSAHDDWVDAFVGAVKLATTGSTGSGSIVTASSKKNTKHKTGIHYPSKP